MGAGPLVSRQEQKGSSSLPDKLWVGPGLTVGKCGLCSSIGLHTISVVACGIPGHALHEKGLQRQNGFGPLLSTCRLGTVL